VCHIAPAPPLDQEKVQSRCDPPLAQIAREAAALIRRSLDRDTAERQAAALLAVGRALPGPGGLALLVAADREVQRFSLRQA